MSAISKQLSGFIFTGAAVALASASWKGRVNAVYGFTSSGTGYQVFKPTSQFNSLTQLVADGVYIVDAATPGFELPGAVLTGSVAPAGTAGLGAGPLSFAECGVRPGVMLDVSVGSSDPDDRVVLLNVDTFPPVAMKIDVNNGYAIGLGSLPSGASYTVTAVNRLGNVLTRSVTVP